MIAVPATRPHAHPSLTAEDVWQLRKERNFLPADNFSSRYTFKARGAIFHYLMALPRSTRREVLLPSYHCPTIVYAIRRAGYIPRYYGVLEDLTIDLNSFRNALGPQTAAALIINYFGFPTDCSKVRELTHAEGAYLLEDCSHSFLKANPLQMTGGRGDASVFALWKLIPSGAGGLVTVNNESVKLPEICTSVGTRTWLRGVKRLLDQVIDSLAFRPAKGKRGTIDNINIQTQAGGTPVRGEESNLDVEEIRLHYPDLAEDFETRIPAIQKLILTHTELQRVAAARRANYLTLLHELEGCREVKPLFGTLPDTVVPWCLPIRIKDRSQFDFRMRRRGVPLFTFGERLHPSLFDQEGISRELLQTARSLRDSVLCIGIHQNLNSDTIKSAGRHIIEVISEGPLSSP